MCLRLHLLHVVMHKSLLHVYIRVFERVNLIALMNSTVVLFKCLLNTYCIHAKHA